MIWNVIVTCSPWKIENSWANSLRGTPPEETLPGAGDQIGSQRLQRAVPPKPQSQWTPLFSGRVWLKGFFMCCLLALVCCWKAHEHICSHALPRGNGLRPSVSVWITHTACSTLQYVAWFNPLDMLLFPAVRCCKQCYHADCSTSCTCPDQCHS